jgi:hypothetical protein
MLSASVLFPIAILIYFLYRSDDISRYGFFIGAIIFLLIIYLMVVLYALRRFAAGIKMIEVASIDLVEGRSTANGYQTNITELKAILKAIQQVQQDVQLQTQFAEQLKTGNVSSTYSLRHNHDNLGKALLGIKENLITIKQEDDRRKWTSDSLAKFVQILQSAKNLKELSHDIIVNLVRTINANQGAIFILVDEEDRQLLDMQACYAFDRSKHLTQRVAPGEGLIGQAFLEKETIYLKDVPDKFVRITSGLGEANPRYILIVPLKMNDDIVGIAELASFKPFDPHVIAFVEKIGESIAHAVSSFRTSETTKRLLDESNSQTEALRAQEEELRQNQEELQATQEAISRKYDTLFKQLGDLNYQSKFDQLKSITSTKKRNVEYYFDIIRSQIVTYAENTMVIEAVKAFKSAYHILDGDVSSEKHQRIQTEVAAYYTKEFIPRLNENISREAAASDYTPTEMRTLRLQQLYISSNPHPTGSKSILDSARDGSDYSNVHAQYHPILRSFLEKFGYYDIFLIDAKTGDMLYSVFKEVDFATNLFHGLYSTTNFGKVVQRAAQAKDRNFVQLIDFEPYDPSYHAPACFIATVVYDGEEKIGILVFQMPINKINQILTGNNRWRDDGLGDTGETFIVGSDYKLRSISRRLIENLDGHVAALKQLNYSSGILQQIRKMQTSILMEEVKTEGIGAALQGKTGTAVELDGWGEKILNAYAPLSIPDVEWVIASTMNEEEASLRIRSLRDENL